MQKTKMVFGSVLVAALLFSSVSEAAWWNNLLGDDEGNEVETQLLEKAGRMSPSRMKKMRSDYGESQSPRDMEKKGRKNNLRERFVERQEEMFEENGIEMPENWEEMTAEERQEFLEENEIERPGRERGEGREFGQNNARQKQVRNLIRRAKKGKNFKKFTGKLRQKKEFKDKGQMRNPEAVAFMQQRGIMEGYDDGTFGAENPINRAESLKVLLEALGIDPADVDESKFDDVEVDAWYAKYVEEGRRRGIVKGYKDGSFRPGDTVNQAELLKISFESFGIDLSDYGVTDLPDGVDADAWYAKYLQYALDNDLLDEDDVDLSEGMTREMFAEVISRLIQQQEELEGDSSDSEDEDSNNGEEDVDGEEDEASGDDSGVDGDEDSEDEDEDDSEDDDQDSDDGEGEEDEDGDEEEIEE